MSGNVRVFCSECDYVEWIPVDGPALTEARCTFIKEVLSSPIRRNDRIVYAEPYKDNKLNRCPYYLEKQKKKFFNWSW